MNKFTTLSSTELALVTGGKKKRSWGRAIQTAITNGYWVDSKGKLHKDW